MSELQYSAAQGVQNLTAGESVYQIDSGPHAGKLVRISVTRKDEDQNGDGVPDQINLKVIGAVIDIDNAVQSTSAGALLQVPAKVEGIIASALAEGTVDLVIEQARMIDECVHRVLRHISILQAVAAIPAG